MASTGRPQVLVRIHRPGRAGLGVATTNAYQVKDEIYKIVPRHAY